MKLTHALSRIALVLLAGLPACASIQLPGAPVGGVPVAAATPAPARAVEPPPASVPPPASAAVPTGSTAASVPPAPAAVPPAPATATDAPASSASVPSPAPASGLTPAPEPQAVPASTVDVSPPPPPSPGPLALLLPPRGSDFGRAAAALRAGFEAARERDAGAVPIETIETADDAASLAARYRDLAARGVAVVVGPLTRAGVNALADLGTLPVPTLALNQPDTERRLPANALAFGLPIEGEVRQLARLAFADAGAALRGAGRMVPHAVIISAPSPLARRAATAFHEAWREQGGSADSPAEFEPRARADLGAQLASLDADAVFVAGGADLVRAVRAAVAEAAIARAADASDPQAPAAAGAQPASPPPPASVVAPPLYATSMMTVGGSIDRRLADLDGVRTIEMPWFAAPERVGAQTYPRPQGAMANVELQRLYALGIDAYRVAVELGRGSPTIALDGMTGRLSHDGQGARLERTGLACEWRNGAPVPIDGH